MVDITMEDSIKPPVTVDKPIPLTFDLGNLAAFDTSPLPITTPTTLEDVLYNVSRDSAQLLINQILTAIPLKSTQEGVYAELPDPITPIPREKPVPKPKEPTKWELFAKKKGIAPKAKDGKLIFDDATQEWVPKWGYNGANKTVEKDWLVEVDEKAEAEGKAGEGNPRMLSRVERVERMKKNDRQQKKNDKNNARGGGVGKAAITFGGKGVKKRKY